MRSGALFLLVLLIRLLDMQAHLLLLVYMGDAMDQALFLLFQGRALKH